MMMIDFIAIHSLSIYHFNQYIVEIISFDMGETTINGSCLCKGIHFTVKGQDKGAVLCHCSNCKSFSGSTYGHNYRMMKTTIDYQKGKDLVRSYRDDATKSGKVLERFFCSRCVRLMGSFHFLVMPLGLLTYKLLQGASLMNVPEAIPGLAVVCAGAIEGDNSMKPKFELFEEDRRPWLRKVNGEAKL